MSNTTKANENTNSFQTQSVRMDQDVCYPFHKKALSCIVGYQAKNYTQDQSRTKCIPQVQEYKRCMEEEVRINLDIIIPVSVQNEQKVGWSFR